MATTPSITSVINEIRNNNTSKEQKPNIIIVQDKDDTKTEQLVSVLNNIYNLISEQLRLTRESLRLQEESNNSAKDFQKEAMDVSSGKYEPGIEESGGGSGSDGGTGEGTATPTGGGKGFIDSMIGGVKNIGKAAIKIAKDHPIATTAAIGAGIGIIGSKFDKEGKNFKNNAPTLMKNLMNDYGLTKEQAAGIVGNLAHESGGLVPGIQEKNPKKGRGGLGWAQWTGPRRNDFEKYLKETNQKASDPNANYGFLKRELESKEYKNIIPSIKKASSVEEATRIWHDTYEKSADIKNGVIVKPQSYSRRVNYANKAAKLNLDEEKIITNTASKNNTERPNFDKDTLKETKETLESRKSSSKTDIKNLNAEYATNLSNFIKDAEKEFGRKIQINSAFRAPTKKEADQLGTTAIQPQKNGRATVASTYGSMHGMGIASDVFFKGYDQNKMNNMPESEKQKWLALAQKHNLDLPMRPGGTASSVKEWWHIEPKGAERGGAKKAGLKNQEYIDYIKQSSLDTAIKSDKIVPTEETKLAETKTGRHKLEKTDKEGEITQAGILPSSDELLKRLEKILESIDKNTKNTEKNTKDKDKKSSEKDENKKTSKEETPKKDSTATKEEPKDAKEELTATKEEPKDTKKESTATKEESTVSPEEFLAGKNDEGSNIMKLLFGGEDDSIFRSAEPRNTSKKEPKDTKKELNPSLKKSLDEDGYSSNNLSNLGVSPFGRNNSTGFGNMNNGMNQNPFGSFQNILNQVGSTANFGMNLGNVMNNGGIYGIGSAANQIGGVMRSFGGNTNSPILSGLGGMLGNVGNMIGGFGGLSSPISNGNIMGRIMAGSNMLGSLGNIFGNNVENGNMNSGLGNFGVTPMNGNTEFGGSMNSIFGEFPNMNSGLGNFGVTPINNNPSFMSKINSAPNILGNFNGLTESISNIGKDIGKSLGIISENKEEIPSKAIELRGKPSGEKLPDLEKDTKTLENFAPKKDSPKAPPPVSVPATPGRMTQSQGASGSPKALTAQRTGTSAGAMGLGTNGYNDCPTLYKWQFRTSYWGKV